MDVYDPSKYDDAEFLPEVTFKRMRELNIQIMDQTAVELIENTDIESTADIKILAAFLMPYLTFAIKNSLFHLYF